MMKLAEGIQIRRSPVYLAFVACLVRAVVLFLQPISLHAQDSICARVKIEILQELTLERDAFEARMTIHNGVAGVPIENIRVEVRFLDATRNPVRATSISSETDARFFYRLQDGYSIPSSIAGATSGAIRWLIIPAPGSAGPTAAGATYYVGAILRYRAAGVENEVVVEPDDILVKPMPALTLDYFLPSEVYGDDPFTQDFVEPPIPFYLGVRVKNSGVGAARKLKIDSAQPRIVENKLGLLVDFKLHGSEVNGNVAQPTLLADFGDIAPNRSGVARWIMTSTLSGRFVEFNAFYTHSDELGGQLTSLFTSQPRTHFLVHDVLVDLPGRDAVRDFLAKDGFDLFVYESENADTAVIDQSLASVVVADGGSWRIRTVPSGGFIFIRLTDPFAGRQLLRSIRRGDGKQLADANAWLSQTWDRSALKWSYYVNVFDVNNTVGADYFLDYRDSPARTNRPPKLDPLSSWVLKPTDRLSFRLTASDLDGDRLVYRLEAPIPASASVGADGTFTWLPVSSAPSTNRLTVTVTDNGLPALSDQRSFTVIVREASASQAPILLLSTNLLAYSEFSGAVPLDLLAKVTDTDTPVWPGGQLTVSIVGGSTENDALNLTKPSSTQTNFTVTQANGVEFRGTPIGDLALESGETNRLRVQFNANANLAVVQELVRSVTFENRKSRDISRERVIQFVLEDGAGGISTPVDLDVEVWPINHPPLANNDEAATTADVPIALPIAKLVGNDLDADGDPLAFQLVGSITEQRGTVDVVGNSVIYVPNPDLNGFDSFRYRIIDPYGGWAEADVRVSVKSPTSATRTIVSVVPEPGGVVKVTFLGIPNRTYTVQWSFDLLYWSDLMQTKANATGVIEITDRTADPSRRFYRITYP